MSLYPDNLGYFDAVQVYFTEVTGRAMFFSGRDLELLETWRERGASAATVCKGVREAVESMPDSDPPRDLHACRSYIEPRVDRADRRTSGGHDSVASDPPTGDGRGATPEEASEDASGSELEADANALFDRALDNIERAGRQCDRDMLKNLYRWAWREVRDLAQSGGGTSFDDYDRLMELEKELVNRYFQRLDQSERDRIDRAIREENREILERMSAEARKAHVNARRRRMLAEEYNFIPILD